MDDGWKQFEQRIKDLEERESLEKRIYDLEEFVAEVKSGKKVLLFLCVALAGVVATVYYGLGIWKGWHG